MSNKEFLEIDETSLPNVELSMEQIEKTKKRLFSYVQRVKEENPTLNINPSIKDIKKIQKTLGENAKKVRHGVQNANVLKELVINALDEEVSASNSNIIFKDSFLGCFQEAVVGYIPLYSDTTYYYRIYVTDDKLIIYNLDWFFKVIKKHSYSFNEIEKVGVAPQYFVSKELDRETILIKLKDNVSTYGNMIFLINESKSSEDSINKLNNALTSLGVAEYDKNYFKKAHRRDNIIFWIYTSIWIVFGISWLLYLFN